MTDVKMHPPGPTTVPADHLPPGGGVDAETPCTDCEEQFEAEHFGPASGSVSDAPWNGAASRFTDEEYQRAAAGCDPGAGSEGGPTIKQGCFAPHHEPSGTPNRNGVHSAAARFGQLKGHDAGAMSRAKAHLRSHYKQMGEDPPESIAAAAEDAEAFALHEPVDGQHTHAHPAMGSQGDDATHEHMHAHAGDASHAHSHGQTAAATESVTETLPFGWASFTQAPNGAPAIVASLIELGSPLGVEETPTDDGESSRWVLYAPSGERAGDFETYQEAVSAIGLAMQERSEPPGRLAQRWRSEMAYEGLSTGDGRRIEAGATRFRDCPLPLMLQTETEVGHMGAVLAGAIDQAGMVGSTAVGTGFFDDSEAGRQSRDIIEARGRFGVSIDVSEAEGEMVCTETDAEGDCIDGEMRFSDLCIMGLTLTPFPAFADAYIELDAQSVAASAEQSGGVTSRVRHWFGNGSGSTVSGDAFTVVGGTTAMDVSAPVGEDARRDTLVAAGGPDRPPSGWFADPGFEPGDGRMVRQPNGGWACPHTVLASGQMYGHAAAWASCHTGYAGRCVPPPRSRTGYAAFLRTPLETDDGDLVRVGFVSMGCGHAATDRPLTPEQVRAHYDGGPGATRMAAISVGEDRYGIWYAGSLLPGLADDQVRAFAACAVSGDWREVWRGKGLDLLAVLAGVTVPGYPIAVAADGSPLELPADLRLPQSAARFDEGRLVTLVASGVVRQPLPWERMIATQADRIELLERRVEAAERVTAPLRAQAAEVMIAAALGVDGAGE